jgi:hypothetical protein
MTPLRKGQPRTHSTLSEWAFGNLDAGAYLLMPVLVCSWQVPNRRSQKEEREAMWPGDYFCDGAP